jgi:glutamine synthetase
MSVFIGDTLSKVLEDFEHRIEGNDHGQQHSINIPNIPEILLDNTDRNRTSPFAFTGNKFEFRAVGSSDNCSSAMVVLNTIVANQLTEFKKRVDAQIASGISKVDAIEAELREILTSSKNIIFGGNGYSDEWVTEAARRGLSNVKNTAEALQAYLNPKSVKLFTENGIFSHKELEARTEIRYETYVLSLELEAKVLTEMIQTFVIPSAIKYQGRIAKGLSDMKNVGIETSLMTAQMDLLRTLSSLINSAQQLNHNLMEENEKALAKEHASDRALAFNSTIKPLFEELRLVSDEIERLCDDADWTLPKYRELLTLS